MSRRPRLVAVAVRIYTGAIVLYPQRLRRRYGDEMRRTFDARCRDAGTRGATAVLALLARELVDVIVASVDARRNTSTPGAGLGFTTRGAALSGPRDAGLKSVAANYEEAKGAYSRRDFAAKDSIVLKEARESRLWLRVLILFAAFTSNF